LRQPSCQSIFHIHRSMICRQSGYEVAATCRLAWCNARNGEYGLCKGKTTSLHVPTNFGCSLPDARRQPSVSSTPDFVLERHGSILFLLHPISDAGRNWIDEHIGSEYGFQPYYPVVVIEPNISNTYSNASANLA